MKRAPALFALMMIAGCDRTTEPSASVPAKKPDAAVISFDGPGGSVAIGQTLEDAKRAFPAPQGAEVFDRSMSFAVLKKEGWAWGAGQGTGFEVALDDGKIIAMTHTNMDGPPPTDVLTQQLDKFGAAPHLAESSNVEVAVWVHGDNARFFVHLLNDDYVMGPGTMTVIAPKSAMAMFGYDINDPGKFVDMVDATIKATSKKQ